MDRFVAKGLKKLFALTRTKIRLAEEAHTTYTKPRPLPLVKLLTGAEVNTIKEAKEHAENLKKSCDIPSATLQLMDIIEGVKHKFEPSEYCALLNEKDMKKIEHRVSSGEPVTILLMSDETGNGVNLYIGHDPPKNAIHCGRVPTNLAYYLTRAFSSPLSRDMKLINTSAILGHRTLILNTIHHAIGHYCE